MNRFFYSLLLYLLLPFTPIKLLWRGIKQVEYLQHWTERYGFFGTQYQQPIIWLHCVSVGETRAAAPLIHALLKQYPQYQILLTHSTPTGRETGHQLFGDKVLRAYLPYDTPCAVQRFLRHFQPKIGLLLETELWFNLIATCQHENIPLLLVNARLSERSAAGYAKLDKLVSHALKTLTWIAAQTVQDAQRLKSLGAPHVEVFGNLKFDVMPPENYQSLGQTLRDLLGSHRPIFLAASTRDGEETLILKAIQNIQTSQIPNLLTVIVPRHPQRFDEVASLLQSQAISYVRRSQIQTMINSDISVVLGDSMGEMFTYYAACDFAFIGGSLLDFGGQNLIEPASVGKPVLIGPHTFNFNEVTESAIQAGAAIRINDTLTLSDKIVFLYEHPIEQKKMQEAAIAFTRSSKGATQHTLELIERVLIDSKVG